MAVSRRGFVAGLLLSLPVTLRGVVESLHAHAAAPRMVEVLHNDGVDVYTEYTGAEIQRLVSSGIVVVCEFELIDWNRSGIFVPQTQEGGRRRVQRTPIWPV